MVEAFSVSAITILIIGLVLKYFFHDQEEKAKARAREMNDKMDAAGRTLVQLQIDMAGKLGRSEHDDSCQDHLEDIWGRLNNHCHDASGNVVIPRGGP